VITDARRLRPVSSMEGALVAPRKFVAAAIAAAALCVPSIASADVVVDWNATLVNAMYTAHTAPQLGTRIGAIVQTSVFDSVNGITRRYSQFRPDLLGTAPHGASAPAAAASAAYTALVALFPGAAFKATFDAQLAASLAQISHQEGEEGGSRAVSRGVDWGKSVANAILAWRSGDGLTPVPPLSDYVPGTLAGDWLPQPGIVNPVFRQFAKMAPWTMSSPSQFRPTSRPSLTSPQYLADLLQVKLLGNVASVTPEHFDIAWFWQGKFDTVATIWNRTADSLAMTRHRSITDNARIFGLLNVALADSTIAVWEAKNWFNFWRPITAIQVTDPSWKPTIPTPNHQEFPSGHSGASGAAAAVLASFFGERTTFTVVSDGVAGAGGTRTFAGFAPALEEVALARVYGGIHFLDSCTKAQTMGRLLAEQAMATQMLPRHGDHEGQEGDQD
jgi:membrane-associated phospholipid phosphatase